MCNARIELSQLMETCECSSHSRPAEGDTHTLMEFFQIAALGKSCNLFHLQPSAMERSTNCVSVCAQMCLYVYVCICRRPKLQPSPAH